MSIVGRTWCLTGLSNSFHIIGHKLNSKLQQSCYKFFPTKNIQKLNSVHWRSHMSVYHASITAFNSWGQTCSSNICLPVIIECSYYYFYYTYNLSNKHCLKNIIFLLKIIFFCELRHFFTIIIIIIITTYSNKIWLN
jgi:hypothetical protein